jgi:hypothetical protein
MMNLVKRSEQMTRLASLVVAGALCFAGSAANAAQVTVGTATGVAGGNGSFDVTLQSQGTDVLGTQNDIEYTVNTPIAVSALGNCGITTSMTCTQDSDCPELTPPPLTGNEPCVNKGAPDCQVKVSGKGGFFAFTPSNCGPATTACTGVRALIFALNNVTTAIPDGSVLYSCTVSIAPGVQDGDYALTVPSDSVSIADTSFQLVPNPTAVDGKVTVGPAGNVPYTVCDVSPQQGDESGQFGDGTIDIFDVRALFNAESLGIEAPADGTARFSAMDSSPVDTPPTCGGDQTLDIFDVRQCFNVNAGLVDKFVPTGTGASCTSEAAPQ